MIQSNTKSVKPYAKRPSTYSQIDTVKNTDPSLRGQYQFMLSRSKTINGYKLINPTRLNSLWQSVTDTIRKERIELTKDRSKISEQQQTIANLQAEVSGKENSLNDSNAKLNEINFLGISFTKGSYQMMVWSIILILAIALFVVIARSTKNILEARHRTQLYEEISAEYQAYKAKANEQQRKLARELQDERNTIEEMKNRGK
ncbi:MAG: hypothetical protein K2P75_05580 [Sphingobacteriaceae bacterium]|nr:hypothetical protein [Sphingobacteriaceae bacterium]